jgi:hypothetical protein
MNAQTAGAGSASSAFVAPADAGAMFKDLIPAVSERAADYRVSLDVIDEEIFGLFAEQVLKIADPLAAACARGDESAVRAKGHSLEGMGGTVGFPEVSVVGAELSRAAKAHDWARCAGLAERLIRWSRTLGRPHPPR